MKINRKILGAIIGALIPSGIYAASLESQIVTPTGLIKLFGSTSGVITFKGQAAAGTYEFDMPTSAGSTGQPMLSGGGSGAAMTFGTLGVGGGGTGATTFTANVPLIGNGTSAVGVGARSGNTTTFATTSGGLTSGDGIKIDASGNLVDNGVPVVSGAPNSISGLGLSQFTSLSDTTGYASVVAGGKLYLLGSGTDTTVRYSSTGAGSPLVVKAGATGSNTAFGNPEASTAGYDGTNLFWLCTGSGNVICYSSTPTTGSYSTTNLTAGARGIFSNGTSYYAMVGGSGNIEYRTSITGSSTTITCGTNTLLAGVYGSGATNPYVIVGAAGQICYGTAGTSYTSTTAGSTQFNDIAFGGGTFCAVGQAVSNNPVIYSSTNGQTWTARTNSIGNVNLYGIAYGNATFVAVGGGRTIATSPDCVTWTVQTAPGGPTADNYKTVSYGAVNGINSWYLTEDASAGVGSVASSTASANAWVLVGSQNYTINIAPGQAVDSTAAFTMTTTATLQCAAGAPNGAGGLDTGTIASSTWYAVLLINGSNGTNCLFTKETAGSAINPTLPSGYIYYRYIGSVYYNATPIWATFYQIGQLFQWGTPVTDLSTTSATTASLTLSVPISASSQVFPIVKINAATSANAGDAISVKDLGLNATTSCQVVEPTSTLGDNEYVLCPAVMYTNTSGQISYTTTGTTSTRTIITQGWIDPHVAPVN